MKIYRCKKVDSENCIISVGMKFFIYDGILYPWKAKNGVGIELDEVGLGRTDIFEEYFEVCDDVGLDQIPMLVKEKEYLINQRDSMKKEVSDIEEKLAELEALGEKVPPVKKMTDAEIFTEVFNSEGNPFYLMSEAAKKVLLQYAKYVEWYNIDFHAWMSVHVPYNQWHFESYRLPLDFISSVVEGYRVQKISGKPFKSGNKIGTIKKLVVNEQCPKKSLAYTFEEDDSCVNIKMCEIIQESHHPCCNYWMNGPVSRCQQCKDIHALADSLGINPHDF